MFHFRVSSPPNVPATVPKLCNEVWVSAVTTGLCSVSCVRLFLTSQAMPFLLFFPSVQLLTVFLNVGIATFTPPLFSLNNYFWVT